MTSKSSTADRPSLAIVAINYALGSAATERFLESIQQSGPDLPWVPRIVTDLDPVTSADGMFWPARARNLAVARGIKTGASVVVYADLDLIFPPKYFDQIVSIALERPYIGYVRHVGRNELEQRDWKSWLTREPCPGSGGFNAMTPRMWRLSGGYNERLSGWGYADFEFRDRLSKRVPLATYHDSSRPLMHIRHPARWDHCPKNSEANREAAREPVTQNFLEAYL